MIALTMVVFALVGLSNVVSNSIAPAQEELIIVKCVDQKGAPVEAAEVYLFQNDGQTYKQFGSFQSNMGGEADCGKAIFSEDNGNFDRWIYARIPGKSVGIARAAQWTNREPFNPEFKVVLRPSRSVKGEVRVADGFDPTQVTVRVQVLHARNGDGMSDYDSLPRHRQFPGLDSGLTEIFECQPNKQGVFEFHDLPVQGRLYLVTKADGLGQAQWKSIDWAMEPDPELDVKREVPLTGTVTKPNEKPATGYVVKAKLQHGPPMNPSYMTTFEAETDKDGQFSIKELPHGKFTLMIEGPDEDLVFLPTKDLIGKPEKGLKLELKLEPPIRIVGKVTDMDGKPVEAAAISAISETFDVGFDDDKTDENGRYELRVPAGTVNIYFNGLPDGFEYPNPQIVQTIEVKKGQAAIENDDLKLERKRE